MGNAHFIKKKRKRKSVCACGTKSAGEQKGLEDSHGDTAEKLPDYRRRL